MIKISPLNNVAPVILLIQVDEAVTVLQAHQIKNEAPKK